MKFFQLIPPGTNIPFVQHRKRWLMLSLIFVLSSIGLMLGNQFSSRGSALNFGIDFVGGTQVRVAMDKEIPLEELRTTLGEFGYQGGSAVAVPDAENEVMIRVREVVSISDETKQTCRDALDNLEGAQLKPEGFEHPPESSKIFLKFDAQPKYADVDRLMTEAGCEGKAEAGAGKEQDHPVEYALLGVGSKLKDQLDERFGAGTVTQIVSSETVGAKVGAQLKIDGVKSMLFALGFIFLFVMIRFDLRFAPGGIVALIHDSIIVTGAFALTWREFNLQTIAALLTIVGYSINDTIVVFDRVRERVALNREEDIEITTNSALNETLSRTILTSGTTLLVVLATWVWGSGPIKDFAFALFVGVMVGTYSSLFVAAPVFLWVNERFYAGQGHLLGADEEEREGTGTLLGAAASAGQSTVAPRPDPEGPETDPETGPPSGGGEKNTRRRRRRRPQS